VPGCPLECRADVDEAIDLLIIKFWAVGSDEYSDVMVLSPVGAGFLGGSGLMPFNMDEQRPCPIGSGPPSTARATPTWDPEEVIGRPRSGATGGVTLHVFDQRGTLHRSLRKGCLSAALNKILRGLKNSIVPLGLSVNDCPGTSWEPGPSRV